MYSFTGPTYSSPEVSQLIRKSSFSCHHKESHQPHVHSLSQSPSVDQHTPKEDDSKLCSDILCRFLSISLVLGSATSSYFKIPPYVKKLWTYAHDPTHAFLVCCNMKQNWSSQTTAAGKKGVHVDLPDGHSPLVKKHEPSLEVDVTLGSFQKKLSLFCPA